MDEHASVYAGRGRLTAGGGRYIALAFDQPPLRPSSPSYTTFKQPNAIECEKFMHDDARLCTADTFL